MKYEKRSRGLKNKYDRSFQANKNKERKHLAVATSHLKNGDYALFKKEFEKANHYQAEARIALHKRIYAQYRSEKRVDLKQ